MTKTLAILVGPQGSGKSTYCKSYLSGFTRVSQDDHGKTAHLDLFKGLIKRGENVVVDRINHTREQRKRYSEIAKEAGYKVHIYDLNKKLSDCYFSIKKREKHPNLGSDTEDNIILGALEMYQSQYQQILPHEYDSLTAVYGGNRNPYIWDLSRLQEVVIVGDVHGCNSELMELLSKAADKYPTVNAIFCGDLVDKGNFIKATLGQLDNNSGKFTNYSVMGNHESKLQRYLKGNKVSVSSGLQKTLDAIKDFTSEELIQLRLKLLDMPLVIKYNDYYVVHAGINPEKGMYSQHRENLLFTRNWNPQTKSFNTETDPFWFEYFKKDKYNVCFGHQIHDTMEVKEGVFAMDGGCAYGGELRGLILKKEKEGKAMKVDTITVKAFDTYYQRNESSEISEKLEPYEYRVKEGLIRKVEKGDLVLYNYTDKCTFEKYWDQYTLESRGLIFNKKTGEVVARPFPKFFNLGENEKTQLQKLPKEEFVAFEKMDGSLGIIFFHDNEWQIATRGSFTSDQAIYGKKLLDSQIKLDKLNKEWTFLVEIIYPENKIVVDYNEKSDLTLLGVVHTKSGQDVDLNDEYFKSSSEDIGFKLPKIYDSTNLEQLIESKKSLSRNEEGYVVRFNSGFRVKIKGDEYLKISKILSNSTPLSFWEVMKDGKVSEAYLSQIPEELLPELTPVISRLESFYMEVYSDISLEFHELTALTGLEDRKKIAEEIPKFKHGRVIFSFLDDKKESIDRYIKNYIKPVGNILK